jgi:hypothetical protein
MPQLNSVCMYPTGKVLVRNEITTYFGQWYNPLVFSRVPVSTDSVIRGLPRPPSKKIKIKEITGS